LGEGAGGAVAVAVDGDVPGAEAELGHLGGGDLDHLDDVAALLQRDLAREVLVVALRRLGRERGGLVDVDDVVARAGGLGEREQVDGVGGLCDVVAADGRTVRAQDDRQVQPLGPAKRQRERVDPREYRYAQEQAPAPAAEAAQPA